MYLPPNSTYEENMENGTIVCTGYDTSQSSMLDLSYLQRRNVTYDAKKSQRGLLQLLHK